ncbi:TIGR03750 family conjugal transfer protein [Pseudomonas protegens]|uniref:TIGR03750 family conjugal transfer protein n=1 Tax=Pseudomonas protegens TaxID=380021 RepID=A0A2T6GD54_9PSED|nr:TIGR03750 family conjugal transfer protein [Pseudomonas protegens]PUA42072.1 TIGR03750 family conjugal transfer protein [Pseudomonas protegens]
MADLLDDGTLAFLPTRLNNQPVILGGLTADEMWLTVFACGGTGLVLGIPAAFMTSLWGLIPGGALLGGTLGLTLASRLLRRLKRGRPDTWLYRQLQLDLARRSPAWNTTRLVVRSGAWTCRRQETP